MGLMDKAKEAAANAKEKAGPLLDKVGDKAEELSGKEGLVGKVAGSVDKAIDKVRPEDRPGAAGAAAIADDMGGLAGPGSSPSLDDPLPGEGLVDPAAVTPVVPMDPASGDGPAAVGELPDPVAGSSTTDLPPPGGSDAVDPLAEAAEVAAAGAVSEPFGTPADPAAVSGLADPGPDDESPKP